MAKKICPKCGAEGAINDKFCHKCGTLLEEKKENSKNTKERGGNEAEEKTEKARYISTPEPLYDQLRKVKSVYPILGCYIIVIFFLIRKVSLIGVFGLIVTYLIDMHITKERLYQLRKMKFWANNEMVDAEIIKKLQPIMTSKYGNSVSQNKNGQTVITINEFCYTIVLNQDSTFCIRWGMAAEETDLTTRISNSVYYKYYKEILAAMGKIAYEIQAQFGILSNANINSNDNSRKYTQSSTTGKCAFQGEPSPKEFDQERTNEKCEFRDPTKKTTGRWKEFFHEFSLDFFKKEKTNWVAMVSSILMSICVFLPYIKVTILGVTSSDALISIDGWFFLGIAIVAFAFGVLGKSKGVMLISVLAVALTIMEVMNFASVVNESRIGYEIEKGSGYYLMIVSTILLVVAGVYRKIMPESIAVSFKECIFKEIKKWKNL